MEKFEILWSDEFLCGNEAIDSAHRIIISKSMKLHEMIANPNHEPSEMLELANEIIEKILGHMNLEIVLMKKYDLSDWIKHEEDHDLYKKTFDLEKNHSLSAMMRVLLVAEMIKEYMTNHFMNFDMVDMKKVQHLQEQSEK